MDGSKRGKVSNRRRAEAIKLLAETAENPDAPLYLRTQAARSLLVTARREEDAEAETSEPEANLVLPDNGRGPRPANWYPSMDAVKAALAEGKRGTFIIGSPEADAARERFMARQQRRLDQAGARKALPAPDAI